MALLTLPADTLSRLPPGAPELLELLLDFRIAISLEVTGVSGGPLLELGWLTWTLGTPDVSTLFANGRRGRHEHCLALVTAASDALLGVLIRQLVPCFGSDRENSLPLRLLDLLLLFLLFASKCLLLGVSRTFLATRVLALQARLLRAVDRAAVMAASMNAHSNRLFHTLYGRNWSWRGYPFVRLKGKPILCEERTCPLLLHRMAIDKSGFDDWRGRWKNVGSGLGDVRST